MRRAVSGSGGARRYRSNRPERRANRADGPNRLHRCHRSHRSNRRHRQYRANRRGGRCLQLYRYAHLRHWLRQQAHATLVREYEEGYRRRPETKGEIDAAMATAIGLLQDEDDW